MKRFTSLLFALVLIYSCDTGSNFITLTSATNLSESVAVSLPQTNGTAHTYDVTTSQNLNEIISNFNDATSIEITGLTYNYANFTGNTNAVIQSATIKVNNITIATISNVNVSNEASGNTTFTIDDQSLFDQLESLFLTENTVQISFSGSAISDEGTADFDIVVNLSMTVSLSITPD